MNNKGFTLIELLAAIVLLVLVTTVSTYAVTNVLDTSKEKNYDILISNIKSACEVYYQENGEARITVGDLANKGYLIVDTDEGNNFNVTNPKTNESMNTCELSIIYSSNKVIVTFGDNCPETGVL